MAKFGIDEDLIFRPINIAILTVSDTRSAETDTSGDLLVERLGTAGHKLAARNILKDDINLIQNQVKDWIARDDIHVIISTGGTGLTGRDVTVEAVSPLFSKALEGFSVLFHKMSFIVQPIKVLPAKWTTSLLYSYLSYPILAGNSLKRVSF